MSDRSIFDLVARKVTDLSGSMWTALGALVLIVAWCIGGVFVGFTVKYQMYANTIMSIVTSIMVFFIQNSQNRDGKALQLKMDELLLAIKHADNSLINIEELPEKELSLLHEKYKRISEGYRSVTSS